MSHGAMSSGTMSHDMGMGMGMTSTTGAPAGATGAPAMDHGSDDGMAMGGCKISMLWNWNTIDSCFIAESWRVTSTAAFAGSCIGVVLLVMLLELLRRAGKEYDRYLVRTHAQKRAAACATTTTTTTSSVEPVVAGSASKSAGSSLDIFTGGRGALAAGSFRPSVLQQAVRAALHLFQFAVAYFVMLLAMYYNGYIIICIFIGAYLGSFVFHWETMSTDPGNTSAGESPTVCCG